MKTIQSFTQNSSVITLNDAAAKKIKGGHGGSGNGFGNSNGKGNSGG